MRSINWKTMNDEVQAKVYISAVSLKYHWKNIRKEMNYQEFLPV